MRDNLYFYNIGRSVVDASRKSASFGRENSYQILRAILGDVLGSDTQYQAPLEEVLRQLSPKLLDIKGASALGGSHLLALRQHLNVSYNDAAVDACIHFATGLFGLPFSQGSGGSVPYSGHSTDSPAAHQFANPMSIPLWGANQRESDTSRSRRWSILAAFASFFSIVGLIAYIYVDSQSSRRVPSPVSGVVRDQTTPLPEMPLVQRAPETVDSQPVQQRSSTPLPLSSGDPVALDDRRAVLLKPGGVLVDRVSDSSESHIKVADGALKYNNGNVIRGKFVVNCSLGTIDPRDFVFVSPAGRLIKEGAVWTPPFKTRWSAEVKLVSEVCNLQR